MKVFLNTLLAACLISLASCSKFSGNMSSGNVPEAVKKSFAQEHPKVSDADWEKEGEHFEAEFEQDGAEQSVIYNADGKQLFTETEMDVSRLPAAITAYLSQNYAAYSIDEAEKIVSNQGLTYAVEIEQDDQQMELIFDSQGNFLQQESEEEEENDQEEDHENEREISPEALPQVIKDALKNQYPRATLLEADEITQKDGQLTYDVEIKNNGKISELMYDAQGNFLGLEKENDDEDE